MTDEDAPPRRPRAAARAARPAAKRTDLHPVEPVEPVATASDVGADAASARPRVPALSWPVGAVAERLGVSTSTLRSWERRYGLAPTHRTGGNHRRYGPVDVQRVQLMVRLTAAGIPAQSAATTIAAMDPAEVARRLAPAAPRRSALPDEVAVHAIVSAARELDANGLVHLYRQTLRRLDFTDAWSGVFVPSMQIIGERWVEGSLGIESEHLASELLQGELRGVVRANRAGASGTPVLLGSADDDQHHLPLLAVEAELARHGVSSLLLGPRVPVDALAQALDRARPPAVFLWASIRRLPTEPLWDLVEGLEWPLVVVIGGPGWPPDIAGRRGLATVARAGDLTSAVAHIVPAVTG
jgi:DNA-binding transcriptional MerR regulator